MVPSRQGRRLAGAATLVVVAVCVALATTWPTALAAGIADACGKVTSPSPTAAAVEECKSFKIYPGNAFTCDYLTRQSNSAIGDSLSTVFTTMATGFPSGAHEAVHTVCALHDGKKSLAAACEAARDALAESNAAFAELCKASFNGLAPAPPPPPSPPPPPPGPCDRDWVYKKTCLDLFNQGRSEFLSQPDNILKRDQDCPTLRGPTYKCTISVRPDPVTKDCCNIISHRCLCDMKDEVLDSAKGGKVPHCFENISCE